ncbi:MAG: lipocalin family protein [Rikenellaceae bacterium]
MLLLISLSIFITLLSAPVMCSAKTIDTSTVSEFDIERYMGKWYEIARFDNRYERNLTAVTAEYSLSPENEVSIVNRGFNTKDMEWREALGTGRETSTLGRLKVSFFMFFSSDYNVMELGESYEWALVGSSTDKYLWILSRTPSLSDSTLSHIFRIAQERGYNIENLTLIEHEEVAQM